MTKVAFTATRNLKEEYTPIIASVLRARYMNDRFIVGGCVGGDGFIQKYGFLNGHRVHAVIPSAHGYLYPQWFKECNTWESFTEGHPQPYRERNERMVFLCDELIAFPEYPENHPKSQHSGTWMTIRIAWKMGKSVDIHVLNKEQ